MTDAYGRVVDADGHVLEPADVWEIGRAHV